MKILHTADLHLKEDSPRTVEGLEEVVSAAEANDVDVLTVGGDLFDSPEDAEGLRTDLRELLRGNSFDIVGIPGNHDEDVFRKSIGFGEDLEVLVEEPYSTVEMDGVEFVGVPFTGSMTEGLFSQLEELGDPDSTQVLLLHCTLDIGFHSGATGEEEGSYFPVSQATLGEFDFEYVLAGHIHASDREVPLPNGGTFIYPGSPVSHSSKETGRRNAILVDTEEDAVSRVSLDTFYVDEFERMIQPGEGEAALDDVEEWVSEHEGDDCELSVRVDGFIEQEWESFHDSLVEAVGDGELEDETKSVSEVLDHPLYTRFKQRLGENEVEDEEMVETRVIEVLSTLLTQNKVQQS
jgi:exonuclease SbcD